MNDEIGSTRLGFRNTFNYLIVILHYQVLLSSSSHKLDRALVARCML